MSDRSAGKSRADVCQYAGDENLLGRSTVIDIVHQEGEQLIVAQRERARVILDGASEAQLALLGPAAVDPDALTGLVDDDLPLDDSEEAQTEWEQAQTEWIATGFPGCEPAFPVAKDEPRAVDEGFVIAEPDEVKTKAQPSTGRKEVWTYRRWCWWPGCDRRSRKPRRRACGCKCRRCYCSWGFSGASAGCWSWATVPHGFERGSRA